MPNDIPSDVLEDDFDAVVDRQTATFTFSGSQYVGIVHQREDTDKTEDPGFLREYAFAISVRLSQFASAPDVGSTFTALLGKSFKVQKITISPCQLIATYDLDTIHK